MMGRCQGVALLAVACGVGCATVATPGTRVLTRHGGVMGLKLWGPASVSDPVLQEMSPSFVKVSDLAAHPSGDVIVAGVASARADLGLGLTVHQGAGQLAFVGRYTAGGVARWIRVLDASRPRVAVSASGDVAFSAEARRTGPPEPWGAKLKVHKRLRQSRTTFARLSPAGQVRWHVQMQGSESYVGNVRVQRLAFGPKGGLLVAGSVYGGPPSWGDGPPLPTSGRGDIFVARVEAGALVWSSVYGGKGWDTGEDAAWTPQGDVIVVGKYEREAKLGASTHQAKGNHDAFVLKVRGTDGAPIWTRVYGTTTRGAQESSARRVVVREDGEVFLGAKLNVSMPWGSKFAAVGKGSSARTLLTRMSPKGETRWVRVFQGEDDWNEPRALALDASGAPVIALRLHSTYGAGYFSVGGRVLRNVEGEDAIMIRVSEQGDVREAERWGGRSERENQRYGVVEVSALALWRGEVMAAGWFDGDVTVDGHALRAPHGAFNPCEREEVVGSTPAVQFAMQPPPDPCELRYWGTRVGFLARWP